MSGWINSRRATRFRRTRLCDPERFRPSESSRRVSRFRSRNACVRVLGETDEFGFSFTRSSFSSRATRRGSWTPNSYPGPCVLMTAVTPSSVLKRFGERGPGASAPTGVAILVGLPISPDAGRLSKGGNRDDGHAITDDIRRHYPPRERLDEQRQCLSHPLDPRFVPDRQAAHGTVGIK